MLLLAAVLVPLGLGGQALASWLGFWLGGVGLGLLLFGGALLLDSRLHRLSRWMAEPLPNGAPPPLGWLGRAWPGLAGLAQGSVSLRRQLSECEILLEKQVLAQEQEEAQRLEALNAMAQRIEREAGQLIAEMAEGASDLGQLTDEVELSTGRVEQQAMAASTEADNSAQAADAAAGRTAQLADAVGHIAQQISRAAEATRSIADRSRHTRDMFNELEGIIEKIGEVSRLIHEIAGQTNLLALNATIEAARAGEAGKGFAVVASEVKTLAGRTAHATTEIADRLGLIQRQAEQVTHSMDSIGASITELDEVAATVAGAMSEQAIAVNEIAQAVSAAANSARRPRSRWLAPRGRSTTAACRWA
ncbi:methyl-accepting chemotaxis protein [Teichococcus aestuarii]|uniref:methyl-accepting chemotaxis protein n=1 Tax=Teichococcus aestuarii TaxID=568898 RepID=UPI00361A472F